VTEQWSSIFSSTSLIPHLNSSVIALTTAHLLLCATAATAVVRLSHRNSDRLSVCLSHGWISQKWYKLGSPDLHRRLPGRL